MKTPLDYQNTWSALTLVGQLGFWMIASIFLFGGLGFKAGEKWHYPEQGAIVGILAGVLFDMGCIYRKIVRLLHRFRGGLLP